MLLPYRLFLLMIFVGGSVCPLFATKLAGVTILDKDYLVVHFLDGEVIHRDDGKGGTAFTSNHEDNMDTVKRYGAALNTSRAVDPSQWTIKSSTADCYGTSGKNPVRCFRKTRLNGHAEKAWSGSDYVYESTYEHFIYLELPFPLVQGGAYTLEIDSLTNTDAPAATCTFDVTESISEAVHVNLSGYQTDTTMKSADLYHWMGDGGPRDYAGFAGNTVYLYNVASKQKTEAGTVAFWKNSGSDVGGYNLIRSSVWNVDFSGFSTPGTYRLAIEGVGCSQDFVISDLAYYLPFMVSVKGFFYMRIGQDSTGGIYPVPRRPLYLPGTSPANTTVYLTTMHPYHAEWGSFSSGDVWDQPNDWARFRKSGNPVNPNARGGHSDALDWDRHLGHISIIYDMLLPYFLTSGALSDDTLGIAESGNGIPDILDEARNEVDFWLRLRDGSGYSHGLTNPNSSNELFQAAATGVAAWANAANAAFLADCFRLSGNTALMDVYKDSAVIAYTYANGLADPMLNKTQSVGDAVMSGRDLKMTAAAFLYNLTGEAAYEAAVNSESVVTTATSILDDYNSGNSRNQVWGTAAYLFTPRPVNYPTLHANMKASVIYQAKRMEANLTDSRPSRRATLNTTGYFRTAQNVQQTLIAHAVTDNPAEKALFRKAMTLEADYGLGRNPLNMIQMTTATTPLGNKRSVQGAYTSGRNDGAPGLHPGHTPYTNLDDWACGMVMGCPSKLFENCYPSDFKTTWPIDEGNFNSRYVWAHNEFTPQQTMRGKMALYGYLYALGKQASSAVQWKRKPVAGFSGKGISLIGRNLTIQLSEPGTYTIRIMDIAGKTLRSKTCRIESTLMLPAFVPNTSGIYFLELRGKDRTTVQKVLVRNRCKQSTEVRDPKII
jgi:endoglucanase